MLQYSNSSSVMEQNPSKSNRFLYREKTRHSITILRYFGFKTLLTATFALFMAMTMTAQNPDVYVAGSVANAKGNRVATVWKNGEVLYQLTDVYNYSAKARYIYASNGNIYVSMNWTSSSSAIIAKINQGTSFTNMREFGTYTSVSVGSFAVSGSDIYAAVNSRNNTIWMTYLYKNSSILKNYLSVGGGTMYLFGNDVYFALKNNGDQIKVCKNDTELYILHEGISLDDVSSIFVIEHSNAGMNNIQVNDILFYPNPVKDNLFIQIKTNIDKVEIYDFLGKQVLSKNINGEKEINIRDLPKGIYFVNVLSKDKVIGNSKIVKQ